MFQDAGIALVVSFLVIFFAFVAGIYLFLLRFRRSRIAFTNEKKALEILHQQQLLQTQLEIKNETMQYIGREIHDNVGQKLTLASLYAVQLEQPEQSSEFHDRIQNINDIINDSLQELRQLSKSLTHNSIERQSLHQLIVEEVKKLSALQVIEVHYQNDLQEAVLSYHQKNVILRVIQEFCQNSLKHARCQNISLEISGTNGTLNLRLADDGVGFDTRQSNHTGIGLQNMKARVLLLDGKFEMKSDARGTEVKISFALPAL